MRLLLIEDDAMIGSAMLSGMVKAGFAADWARTAMMATAMLRDGTYDLAILDLGLPDRDGMQVLRSLREAGNGMPVLIASARDAVPDRIDGLEAGADDYVLKPFDLGELLARVRAVLRRQAGTATPSFTVGDVVLNSAKKTVFQAEVEVSLSAKEFALLEALMRRPGHVLSIEQLQQSIYRTGDDIRSNAVEVRLHRLRKKLGASFIKNVRGVGYRLEPV